MTRRNVGFTLAAIVIGLATAAYTLLAHKPSSSGGTGSNMISHSEDTPTSTSKATQATTDTAGYAQYSNAKYGFSFRYPHSVTVVTTDALGDVPYIPATRDSSPSVMVGLPHDSLTQGLRAVVLDPQYGGDFYYDAPSFWQRDLKDISANVYTLIQKEDGTAVSAPVEKDLSGESSYWFLIKAIPDASGTPSASVGWNGFGETDFLDTYIVLTEHGGFKFEIIVPDEQMFLQIMTSWHFASSTSA